MNRKIFVVIPVFNRIKFTKKCLASIYNQTYKNYQVILVNDGSTDETQNFVKQKYPQTIIINGNGNWWWTRCMYEGVKMALKIANNNDYVLEMNNDLYFSNEYFKNLIECAKKNKNKIIGSICVRSQNPQEVVESGIRIDWPTGLVYGVAQTVSNKLSYYKNMDVVKDIDALPGKGTLVPISVFKKKINFNYKMFPHYIADYEFAINAKRNGFDLLVCTSAVAKHYWEATGISGNKDQNKISYQRAINLLFGRKSMNNIVDWIRFVKVACPPEHQLRNYYFSSLKVIKSLLTVFPFYYLIPILKILAKLYHATKLFMYRTKLKIVQFPQVYLNKK